MRESEGVLKQPNQTCKCNRCTASSKYVYINSDANSRRLSCGVVNSDKWTSISMISIGFGLLSMNK